MKILYLLIFLALTGLLLHTTIGDGEPPRPEVVYVSVPTEGSLSVQELYNIFLAECQRGGLANRPPLYFNCAELSMQATSQLILYGSVEAVHNAREERCSAFRC